MMNKWKKITLKILAIVGVLAVGGIIVVNIILAKINHHYELVNENMSIVEVRRLLKKNYCESDISIEQIENEGYPLEHLVPKKTDLYAKKYTYHICRLLYFYVIYDEKDKVRLSIPAFE
ncbi:MAG: hypothetical protein K5787_15385 [Lentisphaeria bacterium]|nr:hypothetical protein [Lentisphaeria bacterium]